MKTENFMLSMIVQLFVTVYLQCLHLERMILEPPDAMLMVADAFVRQVQQQKELVPQTIIPDIAFTNIQVTNL